MPRYPGPRYVMSVANTNLYVVGYSQHGIMVSPDKYKAKSGTLYYINTHIDTLTPRGYDLVAIRQDDAPIRRRVSATTTPLLVLNV